ncbi:MAG: hypothetical protein PHS92_02295 [Candidatus Gracilibacteria bacterium]|nr:hypothetical protein [Candidatus Gracilibacteria bacterium]
MEKIKGDNTLEGLEQSFDKDFDSKSFSKTETDNIKSLSLKPLTNKEQKHSKEDVDVAIEKRLNSEISTLGHGANSDELNKKKTELFEKIKKIENIEDKLKAYSKALEGMKPEVSTGVAEQKKQEQYLEQSQKTADSKNTENKNDFFKKLGESIKKELDRLTAENKKITDAKEIEAKAEGNKELAKSGVDARGLVASSESPEKFWPA